MKSMLVIGLGDFGHHLCKQLVRMENEVMAIDKNEKAVDDLSEVVHSRLVADCTSQKVLEKIGVSIFDVCFVCIDSDFQSSLIIVDLLKKLNAKHIVCQTENDTLAEFLIRNGADEIIYPDRDSAVRASVKYSSEHIFDYIDLGGEYSIYKISPVKKWIGKSILDSNIREKDNIYIIGINAADGTQNFMPSPNTIIKEDDHLIILANEKTMALLLKKM